MSVEFSPGSELGKTLKEFWFGLKDNGGARAELRRCQSVNEVVMTPTFQRFCQNKLRPLMKDESMWEDRMAAIVGLIAHLKYDAESSVLGGKGNAVDQLAVQMAYLVSADRPLVSELRFRRLLQNERADLYQSMIRIIRMMKGGANLYGLAHSVFFWGDGIKKRWAYAYFPKVPAKKST
ncbi:MAG: type I-E CRISPR-associated protein Cse2/CasB [Gammaproteobacteria bacterium]|nr:type I-E CRISPR-associated protein Cse2/CasB [Gammaproteobacteria bacterium]MCF6231359.1 type I-E CRISPR-associated protein Cse2/CasB [Gammaproteobacteria bacterium]